MWNPLGLDQHSGLKTLYVCAIYNRDEGDAISLENFERSLQQIGRNTSSHNYLDSRRHEPPWIWLEAHDHGLVQLITNPTRGKNVLDLFIPNNDSLIIKAQVIPGFSDHDAVFVEGNIKVTINTQIRRIVPLYRKADWDGLKEHMSKCLDSIVHSSDCDLSINDLWSSFREELTYGIKRFKPHRLTSSRNGLP